MKNLKQAYGFVLKNIKKNTKLTSTTKCIKGKTFVIAGGTRGIGFNIGKALVEKGANVAILGKTTEYLRDVPNSSSNELKKLQLGFLGDYRDFVDVRNFCDVLVRILNE